MIFKGKFILLCATVVFLLVLHAGCQKLPEECKWLYGEWHWDESVSHSGSFLNSSTENYDEKLIFKERSRYIIYHNNSIVERGHFKLKEVISNTMMVVKVGRNSLISKRYHSTEIIIQQKNSDKILIYSSETFGLTSKYYKR